MNYELFISDLIKPLVSNPENVTVEITEHEGNKYVIKATVDSADLGRVIGRKGRIANSIRTIVHACSARLGDEIDLAIEEK